MNEIPQHHINDKIVPLEQKRYHHTPLAYNVGKHNLFIHPLYSISSHDPSLL